MDLTLRELNFLSRHVNNSLNSTPVNHGDFGFLKKLLRKLKDETKLIQKAMPDYPIIKKILKYEVKLFEGNDVMVERDLIEWQNEDWEIAGDIVVKYSESSKGGSRMFIPMKRIIN